MTYHLYWIHLPKHTDIFSEGYVGITNNTTKRFNAHKTGANRRNKHFSAAVKKFGWENMVKQVIVISNKECCSDLEFKLRSKPSIGWNAGVGGLVGGGLVGNLNGMFGKKHSKETCNKMSANRSDKVGIDRHNYAGDIIATNRTTGKSIIIQGTADAKQKGFPHPNNIYACLAKNMPSYKNYTFRKI